MHLIAHNMKTFTRYIAIALALTSLSGYCSEKVNVSIYSVCSNEYVCDSLGVDFEICDIAPGDTAIVSEKINEIAFPENISWTWEPRIDSISTYNALFYFVQPLLTERVAINTITAEPYWGEDVVNISFSFHDASIFEKLTRDNIGKRLAVAIDGAIYNSPRVNGPIESGRCMVTTRVCNIPRSLTGLYKK